MQATFRLRFLGTIQVERNGEPVRGFRSRKALALLGYLAAHEQPVPREQLADLFWEGKPEVEGRANLSWVLNKIGALLPGCLQADRHTVQVLRTESYWLDMDAFESLAAQGHADALTAAVELYRGEFLEGVCLEGCGEFGIWLVGERERWRQRVASALDALIAHHHRHGEHEQSLRFARQLLGLDPWREEAHQQVMRLLARSGQRSAALAQYETCRQTLARELGLEPARETTALYERIRVADSRRAEANLPAQPTPFVGREQELAQVMGLLDEPECRLLTITGPGGIGKTRLAIQAASAQSGAFLEGVYFVPLAGVSSAEFLASAIADALACSFFGPLPPHIQLVNYLRGKELLLILDNMEHLLEGTAVLTDILQQAAHVKLLVTSRERLNLCWEWCVPIGGLKADSAVQLFQQVARQAQGQAMSPECNGSAVARICQLVEAMPLGIELAAARVRTRTCTEIALEIERNLGFLATTWRDMPDRHKSLQATFEYSWRLLAAPEQEAFVKLSVFRRGFSREAASEVASAPLAVLESLADKSLLRGVPGGRYEMHELLRQYAAEKLSAAPQTQAQTCDRHCAYYAAFLQSHTANLIGTGVAQALAAIKIEIENVRAAWHWAATHAKSDEIARSLGGLSRFYFLTGPYLAGEAAIRLAIEHWRKVEQQDQPWGIMLGRLLTEQARFLNAMGMLTQAIESAQDAISQIATVSTGEQTTGLAAASHLQWGQSLWCQRDYAAARVQLDQAAALARAAFTCHASDPRTGSLGTGQCQGLRQIEAEALNSLGLVCWHLNDYAGATAYCEQALHIFSEIGDRKGKSESLISFGRVCAYQEDYTKAGGYFEQALNVFQEIGDRKGESLALIVLGLVCNQQGDYARAMDCYSQGLRICREIGDQPDEGLALINLGYATDQQGDYAGARTCYTQALRIYRTVGDRQGESLTQACLGLLLHHLGEDQAACEHSRQALHMAREIGNRYVQGYALTRLGYALEGLGQLAQSAEMFQQSLALRRELSQPYLATESLAGLARVSQSQGNLSQALEWVEEILRCLEGRVAPEGAGRGLEGTDEPFQIYLTCYRVLRAAQDARAQAVLLAAHRLLQERAARISNASLRRTFLNNVAAHREIVKEAQI